MFINIPAFIISFSIGIFCVYMFSNKSKPIYVYPTPDNLGKFDYQDKAGMCFEYDMEEIPCETAKANGGSILDYFLQT